MITILMTWPRHLLNVTCMGEAKTPKIITKGSKKYLDVLKKRYPFIIYSIPMGI